MLTFKLVKTKILRFLSRINLIKTHCINLKKMKMKNLLFLLLIASIVSCNTKTKKEEKDDYFKKSYKEIKSENKVEFTEFLDSLTNVYSNYIYYVSFDAPNNWKTDMGVSKHTIFRAYEFDSAISFSINVIDLKIDLGEYNLWEYYKKNKEIMDSPLTIFLAKQLNSEISNLKSEKSYISNNLSLKRTFNYMLRELDFEFENTCIMHQVRVNGFNYTFTLHIPTFFYEEKPRYYQELFLNISFLNNEKMLNKHLGNQINSN